MIFTKKDKRTNLEKEIERVLEKMHKLEPDSAEYTEMRRNLESLYKAKNETKCNRVKPDTIWLVVSNLLGIVLVLSYEETNIIRSKAFGLVGKWRA